MVDSSPLGCDIVSFGQHFLMFWKDQSVFIFRHYDPSECWEILAHKAAHPRIREPSATLLRECHFVVTVIIPLLEASTHDIKISMDCSGKTLCELWHSHSDSCINNKMCSEKGEKKNFVVETNMEVWGGNGRKVLK
jgi:hypothetical protein